MENNTSIKIPKKYQDRIMAIDYIPPEESSEEGCIYQLFFTDDWCSDTMRTINCLTQREVLEYIRNSEPYI